jgi:hypothetical protein
MPIQDFIDTQIKPIIEMGGEGASYWWSPSYWQRQSADSPQEHGIWWTAYQDTNPNITQFDINAFPTSITGPDGTRWVRSDAEPISQIARWYKIIDTYPLLMRQEIARLGLESNPTISAWISSFPTKPGGVTHPVAYENKLFFSERQQYFNNRHLVRMFFKNHLLDGADPSNPSDARLGSMAGGGPGEGWYAPALHRFIKVAWSKYQLHYANAAKQYIDTNTYAAEWDVVVAFGGQGAFDALLAEINTSPSTGIDPSSI